MNRRKALLAVAALIASRSAYSQPAKSPRIALVDPGELAANMAEGRHTFWSAFLIELRRLGYTEGKNVVIDRWTGQGMANAEGYSELARKAIASQPRLLVVRGQQAVLQVARGTRDIPIVALASINPHLRESLARPGKNVTGIHLSFDSQQLYSKQVEVLNGLLKPGARIAWLGSKIAWDGPVGEAARKGAADVNVVLHPVFVPNPINRPAIRRAFAEITKARLDAVLISPVVELFPYRTSVADLAAVHKLPSLGINRYWAEAGAVIGYGVDYDDVYRRAAGYVDKILKGANPAEMPIQMPTKVELVINLETAKELGIAIPQSVLLRADRVIE